MRSAVVMADRSQPGCRATSWTRVGERDATTGCWIPSYKVIDVDRIDPAVWENPAVRRALAERDVASIYRHLTEFGVSQHSIARLTGQAQSEVSEVLSGRRVKQYDTLVRIAEGLSIPRERMGLSYGENGAYGEGSTGEYSEVDENMQRRDVIAAGALATLGFVPSFAALLDDSAQPAEVPLPSRIGASDVAEVRTRTQQLRTAAQVEGGQARAASTAAAYYRRLTRVPATEQVRRSLGCALAELDELAGWSCYDAGLDRHARWHYRTAVDLAHRAGDDYRVASALRCAGVVDSRRDNPNEAMKLYQLAELKLGNRDPDLAAWLHAVSAHALAVMGHEQVRSALAAARDGWQATEATERADQNYQSALVYMRLGRLDVAEQLAASVNGAGRVRPVGVFAGILRATIHVQTGEPRGTTLAKAAIDATEGLRSARARERLAPLEQALSARRDSTSTDLAHLARTVRTGVVT